MIKILHSGQKNVARTNIGTSGTLTSKSFSQLQTSSKNLQVRTSKLRNEGWSVLKTSLGIFTNFLK